MIPPIPPPDPAPPRLASDRLPAERYLPGRGPHPGHAPDARADDALWVAGIDRFNQRYYWESHELWERAWRRQPDGWARDLLQGVIQAAAAVVTGHLGRDDASRRLAER
ncbi:MAG TPA: DUF309 domain-containing protein, partial [Myxococcota bacterium]|nr:DUF309 domain-containing protein [Myxococcota bacterium]